MGFKKFISCMENKYQMAEVNPFLLVITFNVNKLNSLIKKQRLAD